MFWLIASAIAGTATLLGTMAFATRSNDDDDAQNTSTASSTVIDEETGTETVDTIDPFLLPGDDYAYGTETVDTIDPILLPGDDYAYDTEEVNITLVFTDDMIV